MRLNLNHLYSLVLFFRGASPHKFLNGESRVCPGMHWDSTAQPLRRHFSFRFRDLHSTLAHQASMDHGNIEKKHEKTLHVWSIQLLHLSANMGLASLDGWIKDIKTNQTTTSHPNKNNEWFSAWFQLVKSEVISFKMEHSIYSASRQTACCHGVAALYVSSSSPEFQWL